MTDTQWPEDDFDRDQYDDYSDECDCEYEEIDILTGIATCPWCGSRRVLQNGEFRERMKKQVEWEESYYEHLMTEHGEFIPNNELGDDEKRELIAAEMEVKP